jgi:hypothetical protein
VLAECPVPREDVREADSSTLDDSHVRHYTEVIRMSWTPEVGTEKGLSEKVMSGEQRVSFRWKSGGKGGRFNENVTAWGKFLC